MRSISRGVVVLAVLFFWLLTANESLASRRYYSVLYYNQVWILDQEHPELGFTKACGAYQMWKTSVGTIASDHKRLFRVNDDGTTETVYDLSSYIGDKEEAICLDNLAEYGNYLWFTVCRQSDTTTQSALFVFDRQTFSLVRTYPTMGGFNTYMGRSCDVLGCLIGDEGELLSKSGYDYVEGTVAVDDFAAATNPCFSDVRIWEPCLEAFLQRNGISNRDGSEVFPYQVRSPVDAPITGDEERIVVDIYSRGKILVFSRSTRELLQVIDYTDSFYFMACYKGKLILTGKPDDFSYVQIDVSTEHGDWESSIDPAFTSMSNLIVGPGGLIYGVWGDSTSLYNNRLLAMNPATAEIVHAWRISWQSHNLTLSYDSDADRIIVGTGTDARFSFSGEGHFFLEGNFDEYWERIGTFDGVLATHMGDTVEWRDEITGRKLFAKTFAVPGRPAFFIRHKNSVLTTRSCAMNPPTDYTYDPESGTVEETPYPSVDYGGLVVLDASDTSDKVLVNVNSSDRYSVMDLNSDVVNYLDRLSVDSVIRRSSASEPDGWYVDSNTSVCFISAKDASVTKIEEAHSGSLLDNMKCLTIRDGKVSGTYENFYRDGFGGNITVGGNALNQIPRLGYYYRSGNWYYIYNLGKWMYVPEEDGVEGYWFYDFQMGWLWSKDRWMPSVYSYACDRWYYWYLNTSPSYAFYNYTNKTSFDYFSGFAPESNPTKASFHCSDNKWFGIYKQLYLEYENGAEVIKYCDRFQYWDRSKDPSDFNEGTYSYTKTGPDSCTIEFFDMVPDVPDESAYRLYTMNGTIRCNFINDFSGTYSAELQIFNNGVPLTVESNSGTFELFRY